jgi:hypothetical protein
MFKWISTFRLFDSVNVSYVFSFLILDLNCRLIFGVEDVRNPLAWVRWIHIILKLLRKNIQSIEKRIEICKSIGIYPYLVVEI